MLKESLALYSYIITQAAKIRSIRAEKVAQKDRHKTWSTN